MYERPLHRTIARILPAFNASALRAWECYFAGGTRIALELREFRQSRDIDFLCSAAEGYANMRLAVREQGYAALFDGVEAAGMAFPREIRSDQYGIRFPVVVGNTRVKVELVREARFELSSPVEPGWSPVSCISPVDCFTSKLLANSDRWADRDSLSRDLLDLAALRLAHGPVPEGAWQASELAYKRAIVEDLTRAASLFEGDARHRTRCFEGLEMSSDRHAEFREAVRLLAREAVARSRSS